MPQDERRAAFPTTRISLIQAARGEPGPEAQEALSVLCRTYWYPIYAYLRRHGSTPESAEDLTQGFFARVIEKHYLRDFQRERGRFRSYLLAALKHFVANERDWNRAAKRGGAVTILPLEVALGSGESRYRLEPHTDLTPEKLFERQWALAVLARVQEQLQVDERLKVFLTGEGSEAGYRALAAELETTESALKVAIHRLRRRFRDLLREEIAHTVASPDEVGDELRYLWAALR